MSALWRSHAFAHLNFLPSLLSNTTMPIHSLSRRQILQCMTALTGAAMLPTYLRSLPLAERPLGLQLYTLGDEVAKDLTGTLQAVAAIGYREVELPSFYGRPAKELRAALDSAGLACPSVHVPASPFAPGMISLADDPAKLAAEVHALGARYVVMPLFLLAESALHAPKPGEGFLATLTAAATAMTADEWKRTAAFLNEKGREMKRLGLQLAYHNHNPEFLPLPDGANGFELLVKNTDPKLVAFELDVGWVAAGGADPVKVLSSHPGRIQLLHLKDLKTTTAHIPFKMNPSDVGAGIIDWPRLLHAARTAKIDHYFVEQEPPFERPRIESSRIAFQYLQGALRKIG
jgi:sugar phosphate isomerase/epimerase